MKVWRQKLGVFNSLELLGSSDPVLLHFLVFIFNSFQVVGHLFEVEHVEAKNCVTDEQFSSLSGKDDGGTK